MGMVINTNVDALNALRNLSTTSTAFASSVQKLSSGLRITTAADDAAGLAISNKLSAQVSGLNQAQRNAQDGVSMVQTAEGALTEVQSMLQRIRELAVQANNSTVGASDAQSINTEVTALQAEIDRISTTTTFNNQQLLSGALSGTGGNTFAAGTTARAGYVVSSANNTAITASTITGALAGETYAFSDAGAGKVTLTGTGTAAVSQTLNLGTLNANSSTTLNFDQLGVTVSLSTVAASSNTVLAAGLAGAAIVTGTATASPSAHFQIGANAGDTLQVNFANAGAVALGLGDVAGTGGANMAIKNFNDAALAANGKTWAADGSNAATALITATDNAISALNGIASNFGAVENRLNHTIASVGVASSNLNASESRIKDLNVAAEMVNFTKTQILQQAGTAVLAQANSAPQNVLTLLR